MRTTAKTTMAEKRTGAEMTGGAAGVMGRWRPRVGGVEGKGCGGRAAALRTGRRVCASTRLLRSLARFGLTLEDARTISRVPGHAESVERLAEEVVGWLEGEKRHSASGIRHSGEREKKEKEKTPVGRPVPPKGNAGEKWSGQSVVGSGGEEEGKEPPRARVVCVVGPSGSGKSTFLRVLAERAVGRGVGIVRAEIGTLAKERRAVADVFRCSIGEMMSVLASAGLAEAPLLARRVRQLSEGERWRLALAMGMDRLRERRRAGVRAWLVADEFCSTLDRTTAMNLCAGIRRWLRRESARDELSAGVGVCADGGADARADRGAEVGADARRGAGRVLIVASGHEDVVWALGPDVVVRFDSAGGWRVEKDGLVVEGGGR